MKLIKMTKAEFDIWGPRSRKGYAEDKVKANGFTIEEAQEIADRDFLRLLPEGHESKDNYLFSIQNDANLIVGSIWFCARGAANNRKAFVCDIIVEEKYRGQGFAKMAMRQIEAEAKKLNLKEIGLHVFGFNDAAIHIYKSLGYQITDLSMSKKLG